jgi:hypothetical protein
MRLPPALLVLLLGGCGAPAKSQPPPATPPPAPSSTPLAAVEGATVFDASGAATTCAPPRADCPESHTDPDFTDRCRLGGFQIRRCGCAEYCSGKVGANKNYYDASGAEKACAPAQKDCTPPETSAAFQDACNDGGQHLVVCGCEWLCDGPLKH